MRTKSKIKYQISNYFKENMFQKTSRDQNSLVNRQGQEYEIALTILDSKINRQTNEMQYLVRWKDTSLKQTWQNCQNFSQCLHFIKNYEAKKNKQKNQRDKDAWRQFYLNQQNRKTQNILDKENNQKQAKKNPQLFSGMNKYNAKNMKIISRCISQVEKIIKSLQKVKNPKIYDHLIEHVNGVFKNQDGGVCFVLGLINSDRVVCTSLENMREYFPRTLLGYYQFVKRINTKIEEE